MFDFSSMLEWIFGICHEILNPVLVVPIFKLLVQKDPLLPTLPLALADI